ncbi:Por secretion system C-terminal sorting domain-containing protein [Flavobacterium fluvii]|uniref:Por secretion system C-terminal sorting domain-containing protein n=1 Tax=Flavobacterium fluvii TaxID=468056 RepID=A0A1M5FAR2_9FLAO|nr:PQQ-dependent sugar dehydrogenase [Flavobacterium fluvii]SHF88693.1 Por secretion system C-terminal sorting domain-containing protein [Flavobacterium fluvii]
MKTALLFLALFTTHYSNSQTIGLETFATGFSSPVEIANAGDSRLFVVEKGGTIKILNPNGTINATAFLNISGQVSTGSEQGLLGLAFHPNYASNGLFFINYTNTSGNTVIAKYSVNIGNPNIANPSSVSILLTIAQPFANHNGGTLKFGTDGYLYIGMGDGGSGGDPGNRAQNTTDLLGKMLRIDVNSGTPYGIPIGNPYVGITGADEIWAIGLRNPWKFSFDKIKNNLWIADVGQNNIEEINIVSATESGLNYGWRCYEGNTAYNTTGCPSQTTMKFPIAVIDHSTGACSVTGGYVYNGTNYPKFKELYFFSDYCNPKIGMMTITGTITYSTVFTGNNFSTFGEDNSGELYIASINNGTIYKIKDTSLGLNTPEISQFIVYPNPTKSEITIRKSNKNYPAEITLFDLNGKIILQQKTMDKPENSIKTNHLPKGIYILSIKNDQGQLSSHRLIIE